NAIEAEFVQPAPIDQSAPVMFVWLRLLLLPRHILGVVPAKALGRAHISYSAGCELRRCVPHGSLPPCGGGTGRGVAITRRAREANPPCRPKDEKQREL